MEAWLIYSEEDAKKNHRYIQFYIEEGHELGINISLILVEKLYFGVQDNMPYLRYDDSILKPDFIINRTIYPFLSIHLERMGYIVYNNSKVATICNDKAKTYQFLSDKGIDMIDTLFCKNHNYYHKINESTRNTVVKAVCGHGGSQVFYVNEPTKEELDFVYQSLKADDIVIQPLIGKSHQDLRVYVIGNQIVAAVLRTAKSGFKSNFSLGGEVKAYELNQKEIAIVNKIICEFEFGLVGIDFIIGDNGNLIFNEIEDVVGSRMLYQCSDINIVKLYLEYIRNDITDKK